jgi:hypothetical protein
MTDETHTRERDGAAFGQTSRRAALGFLGTAGFAGLSSAAASANKGKGNGGNGGNGEAGDAENKAHINVLTNPNFITNAADDAAPFGDDTELYDPGPVSVPLNEIIAENEEYDAILNRPLNDGKHQIVEPPEGYDRDDGYDEGWKPITWGEYSEVGGHAIVGGTNPNKGTRVNIKVEDGIPNGQYTIWVVKFSALAEDSDLGPDDPFVTPRGNALVGFHNLGPKFDSDGESENDFTVDDDGDGEIKLFQEGGELSGVPGFRPLEGEDIDDPVEDGPVPFVGEADDYEQDAEDLIRIDNDLREEDEIHFVGAYHYDDQTWGVYPGPWHVNHFSAVFAFDA